ncbi:MAG: cation:proton antiporter [Gammaproteobacteria bacterium]|nr:cation:proton antiporter [Gammaproteobacteria bacterium]
METHSFFLHLLAILLSARLFAEIAVRIKIPAVIGELFAGILLGPSLLGWIEPNEIIRMLAEIGIILLLFQVGLETDVRRLATTGQKSLVVALGGFLGPFMLGFILSYGVFGLSMLVSLFVGGTLTATSIGITVRVLADLNRQQCREGQIVLGAAVLDDVLGVVLLALLYEFSLGGGISLLNTGKVIIFIMAFFALAPLAAKFISLLIHRFDQFNEVRGLIPTTIVSLVLFFAWLAHVIGAPELLGGFAAGLALSRRFFLPFGIALSTDEQFAHRIELQMTPIIQLITPVFFVTVGLSLNLHEVDWTSSFIWAFSILFFILAFITKFLGALVIKENGYMRSLIGLAMVPRGEVGLIFAEIGRSTGIFNTEIYAAMIIVIALTTITPPIIMKWLYTRFGDPKASI